MLLLMTSRAPAPAAPAPGPSVDKDTVGGVLFWVGGALITSVVAVAVVGVLLARLFSAPAVIATGAVLLALLGPAAVGLATARRLAQPIARTLRVVAGLHVVVIAAAITFLPELLADSLRAHGTWWSPREHTELVATIANAAADQLAPAPAVVATAPSTTAPATAVAASPAAPITPKEVFALRAKSVVVVDVRQTIADDHPLKAFLSEGEGHGSGFVVDGGLIVTNHHVIAGATSARIRFQDGRMLQPVHVLVDDAANDLAVLRVDDPTLAALAVPLATSATAVGDAVVVIGSPLGLDYSLSSGLVAARRDEQGTHMVQIDAVIAPGSSGGPVFNDRGDVLGVATAMRGAGLGFAVEAEHVAAVLKAPRTDRVLNAWANGFTLERFDVEGPALPPTTRTNILAVLSHVQQQVETCVAGRPAGELVVTLVDARLTADAVSATTSACFDKLRTVAFVVSMHVAQETSQTGLTARYVAEDGRKTVLKVPPHAPKAPQP
jgi:serine protease Do